MDNIINAWLDKATPKQWQDGMLWYHTAHTFAEGLAMEYGIGTARASAVIAVLSPANDWDRNLVDADAVCQAWRNKTYDAQSTTYGIQVRKAYAILDNPNADILSMIGTSAARKTKAFFQNILWPSTSLAVTADRWICRALGAPEKPSAKVYNAISDAFTRVAKARGIMPSQAQAIVWVMVRGA